MYSPEPATIVAKVEEEQKTFTKIYEFSEFAEICSFIYHFGEKLGVPFTFPRIARLLSCETDVDLQSLTTLLVKLLNKMRLRTQLNRWQPALGRFLQRHAYNCDELRTIGDALDNGGPPTLFFSLPPQRRLRVILFCLETQFHLNPLFKEKVKTLDPCILRTPPLGVDIFGNSYWLFVDMECNFLLYRSAAEDMALEVLIVAYNRITQPISVECKGGTLNFIHALLSDSFPTLEAVIASLKDEKYEKTPISELYLVFRLSAKPESPEPVNFPSPPTLPEIGSSVKLEVDKPEPSVKVEPTAPLEAEPIEEARNEESVAETFAVQPIKIPVENTAPEPQVSQETTCENIVQSQEIEQNRVEVSEEVPGLRRSGRKRKQVEFLAMETFRKNSKSRGKKSISNPTSKKAKGAGEKVGGKKSRREKTSTKRRKRGGKKYRNGHNTSSSCLWTRSPGDSESDNEDGEGDDMWNDFDSNDGENSSSSLLEAEKQSPRDWLEELESDFDLDAEDGDDLGVVAGRNLQRQKAQVLDEAPCQICTKSNYPEWLLLCDSCDLGFHAQCLRPALHLIPEGDWFCPRCLHIRLVTDLTEQLTSLQARSRKLDSAARMQERLNFVNISVTNILRDERTRRTVVDSGSSTPGSEETSSRAKHKRSRYYDSSGSTSDSASSSESDGDEEDEDDEEEEEYNPPARSTRHRNVHYNVNAAFQELDEVLVEDEKYAQERLERSKAKSQHGDNEADEEGTVEPGGPPMPGFMVVKTALRKKLSSSSDSSSMSIGSTSRRRGKRRKRASSGSEEFRPSEESGNDEEDDDEYIEEEMEPNSSAEESFSSDQSWEIGHKRRNRRRRGGVRKLRHRWDGRSGKKGRSRRLIPRFEGPSSDEDDDNSLPIRRSARSRVNYREIDSSEEQEEGEGEKVLSEKHLTARRATSASGSEYAPSEDAEAVEEEDEDEVVVDEDDEKTDGQSAAVTTQVREIVTTEGSEPTQTSNFMAASPELEEEDNYSEPPLVVDSMGLKDDALFQDLVIEEVSSPLRETGRSTSDLRPTSPSL